MPRLGSDTGPPRRRATRPVTLLRGGCCVALPSRRHSGGARLSVDVVIPSAGDADVVVSVLDALDAEVRTTAGLIASVTVVDDAPGRRRVVERVAQLGYRQIRAGGWGRSVARNAGASSGAAELILFLDDDVELDAGSLGVLLRAHQRHGGVGTMGGLRAPAGAPAWLEHAYRTEVLTPASAMARPGPVPMRALSSAMVLLQRAAFEAVGRFPPVDGWGSEDAMLGIALERAGAHLWREPAASAVHHFVPTWDEWLERRRAAGRRLAGLRDDIDANIWDVLAEGQGLGGGRRTRAKLALGRLDPLLGRVARGRVLRHLAGSAAEARGFRDAGRPS